jgi:hypothetical protein
VPFLRRNEVSQRDQARCAVAGVGRTPPPIKLSSLIGGELERAMNEFIWQFSRGFYRVLFAIGIIILLRQGGPGAAAGFGFMLILIGGVCGWWGD